jgi:hypothetical protein
MARKSSRSSRSTGLPSDKQPTAPNNHLQNAPTDKHQDAPTDKQQIAPADNQPTAPAADSSTSNQQPMDKNLLKPSASNEARPRKAMVKPIPSAADKTPPRSVKSRCEDRGHRRDKAPHTPAAKRKGVPLTPLAEKMLHDLQLAGMSARTQESYLRAVRKFA